MNSLKKGYPVVYESYKYVGKDKKRAAYLSFGLIIDSTETKYKIRNVRNGKGLATKR
ncbi:hypothetical protein [Bacillus sp. AG4(2022)]|uniref:hypothetical protein n=1 Tax=Bacillus sp. AG4(2022) TaxID=2962594 RepID=UPI002882BECC|nr:hypothetical protein [Bacillus sp. AG4(2022)]MDT0160403.1 hypothetical protein [Bacillus sp. AG4(2022)]